MARLEGKRQMGRGDVDAVSALLAAAEKADGHRPLGEHKWLDLVHGGGEGFAGLVAWESGHDRPVGYAHLTRAPTSWALEFVVDPDHRGDGSTVGLDLVRQAVALCAEAGGGRLHLWVNKPDVTDDAIAEAVGLTRGRDLYQMRRPLPVGEQASIDVRPFVPGQDDRAWLEVNNRAFAAHPEQGHWDEATFDARQREAWFAPDGFLLHERDGRLAGFCWTKVHADHDPPLGEIYVIAVDPDFAGQGLGRELVLAGLDSLAARGLTVGMLYVDADNEPAVKLYEKLGFTVDHVDRAYVGDVQPPPLPTQAATPTALPMP